MSNYMSRKHAKWIANGARRNTLFNWVLVFEQKRQTYYQAHLLDDPKIDIFIYCQQ